MSERRQPADRILTADLLTSPLPAPSASPLAEATNRLGSFNDLEIGIWEAGPGSDQDTEADEVFLVLSGVGTVDFEDGAQIALQPGAVVRLHAGDRTTWTITDRLRKLYLA